MLGERYIETEVVETDRTFEFSDGAVIVNEREMRETVRISGAHFTGSPAPEKPAQPTRLIIEDAVSRTRNFVAKTRDEVGELSSLLQELTGPLAKA
jgi:hypothetical protein